MSESPNLRTVCKTVFFLRNPKIRSQKTRDQYGFALDNLATAVGREPTLDDLTDDNIAAMMVMLQAKGLAATTVNERRARINCLWGWLAKRGLVKTWPTVPAMPEPKRLPLAWSFEQVRTIMAACDVQGGYVGSVPAWLWWRTAHLVLWDTASRITEIMSLNWPMLDLQSAVLCVPAEVRKGQHTDAVYRLHEETARHLAQVKTIQSPNEEMVFPWPYHPRYLWPKYKRILKLAGLPCGRNSMFHRMRRSVATHYEIAGGDASTLLGHSSRAITKASYIDPRLSHQPQAIDRLPRIG